MDKMNIGGAAGVSGVTAKMIRHYEGIGLIPRPARTAAGYRLYGEADVHMLRFVKRARDLGFSMKEIAGLLALWRDRRRKSAEVKKLALRHVADLERRIAELEAMRRALSKLAGHCHGDDRPQCPILEDLARE
jgi:MerR family copper efflux transcriptional regulator